MYEMIYCYECEKELKSEDVMYELENDKYICEDCYEDYYASCEDCGGIVLDNDIITVNNNRYVCSNCAQNYFACDCCDELFSDDYIAVDNHYILLCIDCYESYYFTCEECGEVRRQEHSEVVDGCLYCRVCADSLRNCIMPYNHKPAPVFFGDSAEGYYGIELEVDDGDFREEASKAIQEAGEEHIYLKEDGSLSYRGFEIVSHPATLEYHMNDFPWQDICNTALSYGYRSHDTETCGLHIHASRSLFGSSQMEQDLTIAKIMLLVDRWYSNYIVRFARRDLGKMRQWADKPNAGIEPEDDENNAIDKAKKTANDRYKAVNLRNRNTVEFRIFKGTLKRNTIIASIQWVDTIIKYCRNTALKDLFSTTWNDVFGNTEYEELTTYLKERNLYNVKGEN